MHKPDMFECDAEGCFDSSEFTVKFTDMTEADICESCFDYLNGEGLVLTATAIRPLSLRNR